MSDEDAPETPRTHGFCGKYVVRARGTGTCDLPQGHDGDCMPLFWYPHLPEGDDDDY